MKYQALSILKPAVDLILDGKKTKEIRSWLPKTLPLKNILLVQNENYLTFDEDEDEGVALALVDFTKFSSWTEGEYLQDGSAISLGRIWRPGYFTWEIENIRVLDTPLSCMAKKGIYDVELEEVTLRY